MLQDTYKVKPIIYSYADFYQQYLSSDFTDYPFWVAHYFKEQMPVVSRDWIFWQHNDGGHVNGITSKVDFDVFSGDSAAFKALLIP